MLKVFYFFKRRSDISADEFHRYWRDEHGPLFCEGTPFGGPALMRVLVGVR